jgi:hypothetical protein
MYTYAIGQLPRSITEPIPGKRFYVYREYVYRESGPEIVMYLRSDGTWHKSCWGRNDVVHGYCTAEEAAERLKKVKA